VTIFHQVTIMDGNVTIGNNVKLGPGTSVYSFLIEDDKFLVAEVIIKDNVYTGPHCVFQPGTIVHENIETNH